MRILLFLTFITLLSSCSSSRTTSLTLDPSQKSCKSYRTVSNLASDHMAGRVIGTKGIERAAVYIERALKASGIKPFFENTYRDWFMIDSIKTSNVVGVIKCKNPTDEYIMLSAHYDHINGKPKGGDAIYNGANDNASGVCSVIEVAKILQKNTDVLKKNVLIVLFSGEESGLKGSKHLANKMNTEAINLVYQLNYEMVGVPLIDRADKVYMTGFNISNMAKQMNDALGSEFVVFNPSAEQYELFTRSDNYPFYQAFNIPAQSISTYDFSNYDYYHHVDDEVEALDYKHIDAIIDLSSKALLKLLKNDTEIVLTDDFK